MSLVGERRHTTADVARSLSSHDSHASDVAASSSSLIAKHAAQPRIAGNKRVTIQSRRLSLRAYEEPARPASRSFDARIFRTSKWLFRHFFHRKEFRRKGKSSLFTGDDDDNDDVIDFGEIHRSKIADDARAWREIANFARTI
jgi:hypothetical protein